MADFTIAFGKINGYGKMSACEKRIGAIAVRMLDLVEFRGIN